MKIKISSTDDDRIIKLSVSLDIISLKDLLSDIYRIQKLTGYVSIKTTEMYLRSLNMENEISKAVDFSPLQTIS